MVDCSVGTQDESYESKANQAWMFFFLHSAFLASYRDILCARHGILNEPKKYPRRKLALPQKSNASPLIWSVLFPECHQKGVKASTAEKVPFFVFPLAFERKADKGTGVRDRRRNC